MRAMFILAAGAALASCTTAPPVPSRSADRQAEFQQLIGGKVAQAPIQCLPNYNANDMRTIDGRTLAFRVGSAKSYIVHLTPGCDLMGRGNYTLLSRQVGGFGLCQNDIQQVVDLPTHTTVGSCSVAEIIPYYRP